ncbi:hypothetical protein [Methylobacterium sp. CCH5-D2]|uniref:hypothetical protein n=1 Tax=Methylobacterium sp. CCH5-D2 TaxID=1768765 RepID=UPI000AE91AFF|nr:hypothetical protein [Methylobacterium sp. CCH5-D2]
MIRRAVLLSKPLFLAAAGFAQAQNLALPVGDWTYPPAAAPECKSAPLTIEKNRLIQRIDQEGVRGEARCRFLRTKMGSKGYIFVKTKCVWDAHVPQSMRESPDNDDDEEFSIKIISDTKILFNNVKHELCSAKSGSGR